MASTSKASNKVTGYLKKIIGRPVGELFSLTSGNVIIGRNRETAEVWIHDINVSRSHCVLKYTENGWFIKDLKSVNGTYLDGKRLNPETFYPLKDGVGIYLGPPGEAPVAFVFLTQMPNEQACEINLNSGSQRNKGETTHMPAFLSIKNNKCSKRQSDSETSTANSSQRKKFATSSSLTTTSTSEAPVLLGNIEDNDDLSDCSITSQDSLKTRVRKLSARKNKSGNFRKKDTISAASTSASPSLRSSRNRDLESKPSTSTVPSEKLSRKRCKTEKPGVSKEFALLNEIFNESESSNSETFKGDEDSQSLLNESKILIDCEPYPFSQPLPTETKQKSGKENKNNADSETEGSVEDRLKEVTSQVEKLKKDKIHLKSLIKELRSEQKKKLSVELQKLLEEELMCNICTEVFVKAVTLGCSHTFCESCITEWKKKQKKCPICREKISSETKILVMDSFINKAIEQLDQETQNKRVELLVNREKAKAAQQKKTRNKRSRGRGRRIRSDSSGADEVRQIIGESSNSIGVQIRFLGNSSPSIQVLQDNEISDLTSDFSDLSDDSDESVEGNGYYGGYGRCYNCGRRGHWAIGCPY